jgi:hypothetical protein
MVRKGIARSDSSKRDIAWTQGVHGMLQIETEDSGREQSEKQAGSIEGGITHGPESNGPIRVPVSSSKTYAGTIRLESFSCSTQL